MMMDKKKKEQATSWKIIAILIVAPFCRMRVRVYCGYERWAMAKCVSIFFLFKSIVLFFAQVE